MKIAVLADIHGNLPAFEIIADHISTWRPDVAVMAGDVINRGPRPVACLDLLLEKQLAEGWLPVRGNHEDYVLDQAKPDAPRSGPRFDISRNAYWTYYKPSFRLDREGKLKLQGVPVPRSDVGDRLRHELRSRSAIVRAVEVALVGQEASFVYLADSPPDPSDPQHLTVALVNAMREEARSAGASFVVVASSQFWFSPFGSHDRLIAELRGAGHDVIDVESEPGWNGDTMQIPGDGHWNANGHEFVSRLVGEWLERGGRSPTGTAR